jgi:hypothetical protein
LEPNRPKVIFAEAEPELNTKPSDLAGVTGAGTVTSPSTANGAHAMHDARDCHRKAEALATLAVFSRKCPPLPREGATLAGPRGGGSARGRESGTEPAAGNDFGERAFFGREEPIMTKRELIEPTKADKRFARRDDKGHFTDDQTDVGKSLAADQRQRSKTPAKKGEGDRGDRQS